MPEMVRVPHAYLVKSASNGQECKVMGWFPPGNTIFLDERPDPRVNLDAASVVGHEMVHYGAYQPVGVSMHRVGCELTAQDPPD